MSDKRPRTVLVGLGAASIAVGAAAMMSAVTAPSARADDLTTITNAVEGDYANGAAAFESAFTDFGSNNVLPGVAAFLDGTNDDLVGAPDTAYIGAVEALTNEAVTVNSTTLDFNTLAQPADYSAALADVQTSIGDGETALSIAASDLASGDYGGAAAEQSAGLIYLFDLPADYLVIGGLEALGL